MDGMDATGLIEIFVMVGFFTIKSSYKNLLYILNSFVWVSEKWDVLINHNEIRHP